MQNRCNSIADALGLCFFSIIPSFILKEPNPIINALELRLYLINPSLWRATTTDQFSDLEERYTHLDLHDVGQVEDGSGCHIVLMQQVPQEFELFTQRGNAWKK